MTYKGADGFTNFILPAGILIGAGVATDFYIVEDGVTIVYLINAETVNSRAGPLGGVGKWGDFFTPF